MNEYHKQAEKFLKDTDTEFSIVFLYTGPYFDDDQESRDVYQFTLKNKRGIYSAKFGDSIHNTERRAFASKQQPLFSFKYELERSNPLRFKLSAGKEALRKELIEARNHKPHAYDILAGLTKYDPGSFTNFCDNYGYDTDSRKAEKVYFAVQEEWAGVQKLFTQEQIEQLAEIN